MPIVFYHLERDIDALHDVFPRHVMLVELQNCKEGLLRLHRGQECYGVTPQMFAEWREPASAA
jgi:hypothetical protein